MNKKTLVLLPFAAMLLTSCGKGGYELPKGYDEVKLTDENALRAFCDTLGDNVKTTTDAVLNEGIESKLNVSIDSLVVDTKDATEGVVEETHVEVKDDKLAVEAKAAHLNEDCRSWKIALDVTNSGTVTYNNMSVKAKNTGAKIYVGNDRLFVDLSNKNNTKALTESLDLVDAALDLDDELLGSLKDFVPTIMDKYTVGNIFELAGMIDEDVPEDEEPYYFKLTPLGDEDVAAVKENAYTTLFGIGAAAAEEAEPFKALADSLVLGQGKGKSIAAVFNGSLDFLLPNETYSDESYTKTTSSVSALVTFDKKGHLSEVKASFELTNEELENFEDPTNNYTKTNMSVKGSIEASFKYGVKDVKLPDIEDYKGLPLSLIMGN